MIFFTDRNLGRAFPNILEAAGIPVERHDAHFGQATRDEVWLKEIGSHGWVAITRDRRIRYQPNELAAVKTFRVGLLVLIGNAPFPDLARSFVATRAQIDRFIANQKPPFIGKVFRPSPADIGRRADAPGRVELWYP